MVLREKCPTGVKYLGVMKTAKSFGMIWNRMLFVTGMLALLLLVGCTKNPVSKRTVSFGTLGGGWENV